MTTIATTRSILAGALAASLLLAAPVAAGAAEPAAISAKALYEGVEIPSARADLNRSATIGNVIIYSQPAMGGAALAYTLPATKPAGGVGGRSRVSEPFVFQGEQWVAIQVPEAAYGTDEAKGSLADPGVAYTRAAAVKEIQLLGDGPAVEPAQPQANAAATQAPSSQETAVASPTATPATVTPTEAAPTAQPAAAYTPPTAKSDLDALTKIVNKIAAALFAVFVMAGTLFILKRPAA